MRVLLDECVNEALRKCIPGHDCQTARYAGLAGLENGQLLSAAETARFDVVLTDVSMPQMDGLELLTKIRDRWPDSRVVLHSNQLTWRVARLARVEGVYACLSKSHNIAQLLKTIASASLAA